MHKILKMPHWDTSTEVLKKSSDNASVLPAVNSGTPMPKVKEPKFKVFRTNKERFKEAVSEVFKEYIEMIDCFDDSFDAGIKFNIERYGCKIIIDGDLRYENTK